MILRSVTTLRLAATLLLSALFVTPADAFETQARTALIVDAETGAVLLDKGADVRVPPASMSKIMTAYMVFEQLKQGKLALDDTLTVSERAWRTGGSKMFVPLGARIKVEDLLRGMIIQSGNDACIVLAEGIAGSEEAFAQQMTKRAREIGLTGTNLTNATGLPEPNHYMTARDLATLALRMIHDFPEYYRYFGEREFTFHNIKQGNRNPLLYKEPGADGLKTGHTEEAGYGLTASVVREGRRIIMVMTGLPNMKTRAQESDRLIDFAFREYANYRLFRQGDTVEEAEVWLGAKTKVALTTAKDAVFTLPRRNRKDLKAAIVYDGPIKAPVAAGQTVGKLVVTAPEMPVAELPLVAAESVDRLGALGRIGAAVSYFVWGNGR